MKPAKQLYFIALLPPITLAALVHSIKEEIATKYHSRYALKIPEHITLIPPFHCSDDLLESLTTPLKNLCHKQKPFEVFLKNFGHFSKSVLFIQASSQPQEALEGLYRTLHSLFSEEFSSIRLPQSDEKFTPHLTIANKDLTKQNFRMAWEELRNRNFEAQFPTNGICMMRHIEGKWKQEKEILFGE